MKLFVNGEAVELEPGNADVIIGGDRLRVRTSKGSASAVAVRQGDAVLISYLGRQYRVEKKRPRGAAGAGISSGELRAPMPGVIVDVLVKEGDVVAKGDKLVVLEAMKTQQPFTAPFDGTVEKLPVKKGDQVVDGALLAFVHPVQS